MGFLAVLGFYIWCVKYKKDLQAVASAPAADVTMLRLAIDSSKPPYTMLFRMSHFFAGTPGRGVTCVVRNAICIT